MKDHWGNEYDGWCLRYPEDWGGRLVTDRFERTRSRLWTAELRKLGFSAVKVRLVVVVDGKPEVEVVE